MKKLILIISIILLGCMTYIQSSSIFLNTPKSGISLSDILLTAKADGELPPGYILLMEWGMKTSGYWEGEYWIEPTYGCIDADDKCWNP